MRIVILFGLLIAGSVSMHAENWPQWRGPQLNGVSRETNLPYAWGRDKNITWKLALPSWSGATPIVWDNHIFLNVADGENLFLWAIDRSKGTKLWERPLGGGNHKERKQNMSSPSPVTDGKRVWVMTGTGMLKGFDFAGKELWARDIQSEYGRGGSNRRPSRAGGHTLFAGRQARRTSSRMVSRRFSLATCGGFSPTSQAAV